MGRSRALWRFMVMGALPAWFFAEHVIDVPLVRA